MIVKICHIKICGIQVEQYSREIILTHYKRKAEVSDLSFYVKKLRKEYQIQKKNTNKKQVSELGSKCTVKIEAKNSLGSINKVDKPLVHCLGRKKIYRQYSKWKNISLTVANLS